MEYGDKLAMVLGTLGVIALVKYLNIVPIAMMFFGLVPGGQ